MIRSEKAVQHRNKRLLRISWNGLKPDQMKKTDVLIKKADLLYQSHTMNRLGRLAFEAMIQYYNYRQRKLGVKRRGEKRFAFNKLYQSMRHYRTYHDRQQHLNQVTEKAIKSHQRYVLAHSFTIGVYPCLQRKRYYQYLYAKAEEHRIRFKYSRSLHKLRAYISAQYSWLQMNKLAIKYRNRLYFSLVWRLWREFLSQKQQQEHHEEIERMNLIYRQYLLKLCSKILQAWDQHAKSNKQYLQSLLIHSESFARSSRSLDPSISPSSISNTDDKSIVSMKSFREISKLNIMITKLQAHVRRRIYVRNYHDYRIHALYSILLIQKSIRRYLAIKFVKNIHRKKHLAENIHNLSEQELMQSADYESRYYEYLISCIILIQRIFRGYIGRKRVLNIYIDSARNKSKVEYSKILKQRQAYEHYQRLAASREYIRHIACIEIQKIIRGYFARKYYLQNKEFKLLTRSAIKIQSIYRKHLAKRFYYAMKRNYVSLERFKLIRKKRGYLLRLFGFATRKTQAKVGKVLNFIGIDPLTYHYNPKELFRETYYDFKTLYRHIQWEISAFQKYKFFNYVKKNEYREQLVQQAGYGFELQDTVRIIEPGHEYQGYTGT